MGGQGIDHLADDPAERTLGQACEEFQTRTATQNEYFLLPARLLTAWTARFACGDLNDSNQFTGCSLRPRSITDGARRYALDA